MNVICLSFIYDNETKLSSQFFFLCLSLVIVGFVSHFRLQNGIRMKNQSIWTCKSKMILFLQGLYLSISFLKIQRYMFFLIIFYFDHSKAGADFTKDSEIPVFFNPK